MGVSLPLAPPPEHFTAGQGPPRTAAPRAAHAALLQPRCLPRATRGGSGGAPGLLLLPSQPCLDPRLACTGLVYLLFWDEQSSPRAKPVRIVQAKVNNDGKALFTPKQQIYIRVFTHCFPRSITCANRSLLLLYGTSVRSE